MYLHLTSIFTGRMAIQKYSNGLVNLYSYFRSSVSPRPAMIGMPLALGVELTNHCNLNCAECASGAGLLSRDKGFMNLELFKKIVAELHPFLFNMNLFFQGEPMMHPGFFSFIEAAVDLNLTVSTNGHFLTEKNSLKISDSGLNKLIVSIDGMDQITYSTYRLGGSLNTVKDGIKNISEAIRKLNSPLKFELQFLVNKYNENQIPNVRAFAKRAGATLKLKSMQVINPGEAEKWLPGDEKYRRYRLSGGTFVQKNRLTGRCYRLWANPVITWDGKVVPCCFDKDADYIMGDLNTKSFREIWFSGEYKKFRSSVFTNRSSIAICRNCTSSLRGVSV